MTKPTFRLFTSLRYDPILLTTPTNTTNWPIPTDPSPFYMFPHHHSRLLASTQEFNWTTASAKISGTQGFTHLLDTLNAAIPSDQNLSPLKVRILLSHDGEIEIETSQIPEVSPNTLFPTRIPPPKGEVGTQPQVSPLTGGALSLGPEDSLPGDAPLTSPWIIVPDTALTTPTSHTCFKTTARDMYSAARERIGLVGYLERKEVLIISEKREVMEGSLTSVFFWREGRWVTPATGSGGQMGTSRRWALERGLCVERVVRVEELVDGEVCWISNGVRGFQVGEVKLH